MNTYVVSFVAGNGTDQKHTIQADYYRTDTNYVVFYKKSEGEAAENVAQFNINRTVCVIKGEHTPAKTPMTLRNLPNSIETAWRAEYDNQGPEVQ